jgi:hypothetical protein
MIPIVKDGLNPDIRFSRSAAPAGAAPATPATTPPRPSMSAWRGSRTLIYNFQDRFKALKGIQKRAGLVPEAEEALEKLKALRLVKPFQGGYHRFIGHEQGLKQQLF